MNAGDAADDVSAEYERARLLYQLHRWEDSERALRHVLASQPDDLDAQWLLSNLLRFCHRYDEAARVAESLIASHPLEPRGHVALARVYRDLGEPRAAVPHARRAVELDPEGWEALLILAHSLEVDEPEEAVSVARTAVRLYPHDSDVHRVLGLILYYLGRYAEAEREYLTAIESRPTDGVLRVLLGMLRLRLGRFDEALADFEAGLQVTPAAHAMRTVSNGIRALGVPDRFADLYRRVCAALDRPCVVDRTSEDVVRACVDVATMLRHAGALNKAREMLDFVLANNPEHQEALRLRDELRAVTPDSSAAP